MRRETDPTKQRTTKQQVRLRLTTKSEDDTKNDEKQNDEDTLLILSQCIDDQSNRIKHTRSEKKPPAFPMSHSF